MISKDEIDIKSQEFDTHTSNIQRDYIYGWLLSGIYTESGLKDYLVLKGGNCFRKAYFPHTRFSNDIDFSIQSDLTEDVIKIELDKVCDFVQECSGVVFEKNKNKVEEKKGIDSSKKIYEARLYFKDFYGKDSKIIIRIRLDITRFDKIYLPVQKRNIIHPYSDYKECSSEISCIKLEEALASKLKCLLQRRHSADLYDYVFSIFLNNEIEVNRSEIVRTLLKLTIFERNPGVLKGLFVELPFDLLRGLWNKFLICPKNSRINFEDAVDYFKNHVVELFGDMPIRRGGSAFYPAKYRNPILLAGASFNLIEIVYDGIKRIVEPYALVYKTKKDGDATEYFYAWDRTGGCTGTTGIKTFLQHKIEGLKILEENFDPRFEVELSKAGEQPKTSYFGKPFSGGRKKDYSLKSYFTDKTHGIVYIYECSICGKRFRRKKRSSRMNKHKDKYGNRCYGSYGIFINIQY